eukprot:359310-Chlamydomonas_euryale.AAC.2
MRFWRSCEPVPPPSPLFPRFPLSPLQPPGARSVRQGARKKVILSVCETGSASHRHSVAKQLVPRPCAPPVQDWLLNLSHLSLDNLNKFSASIKPTSHVFKQSISIKDSAGLPPLAPIIGAHPWLPPPAPTLCSRLWLHSRRTELLQRLQQGRLGLGEGGGGIGGLGMTRRRRCDAVGADGAGSASGAREARANYALINMVLEAVEKVNSAGAFVCVTARMNGSDRPAGGLAGWLAIPAGWLAG